jgi:hypothetical protein
MLDQARELHCSVWEISAIECGNVPIPSDYIPKLSRILKLAEREERWLQFLADSNQTELIKNNFLTATQLTFDFDQSPHRQLEQIRKHLCSSRPGSRSPHTLRSVAKLLRKCFGLEGKSTFDLLDLMENRLSSVFPDYCLRVVPELGLNLSAYSADQEIILSEDIYQKLGRRAREARLIGAHEMAHLLLHSGAHPSNSMPSSKFKAAELEANHLAAEILVPDDVAAQFRTPGSLAMGCDVPLDFAKERMAKLGLAFISPARPRPAKLNEVPYPPNQSVSCFLSYSRESVAHSKWVCSLAEALRDRGVEVRLDQWDVKLGMDFYQYMEECIRNCSYVLLICTPMFAQKANNGEDGVGYEKSIICGELHTQSEKRGRLIPILRDGNAFKAIPSYLKTLNYLDMREDVEFQVMMEQLLQRLYER